MRTGRALRLAIADDRTHFVAGDEPVALCADTAWSAFADATPAEWTDLLRLRRAQGFNAVLISVLPILHDRSVKADSREPFALRADGSYDLDRPHLPYYAEARRMAAEAVEAGLVPMLVVLWCTYVPGTWGAERAPGAALSDEQRVRHLELVADTFADLDPVLVVSGDERFRNPGPIAAYARAADAMKQLAPHCLITLHSTPDADLPAVLAQSPALDFYAYQSGHDGNRQDLASELAGRYRDKPLRPLMNAEPCYEGHGYGGGRGRFTRRDVRRATWSSLLAGASAGIGYGAHGVWQWHRAGAYFTNAAFSMEPFTWRAALGLPGAWDVGWSIRCLREHGLIGAAARQDLLAEARHGVRVAARGDAIAVYTPFAQALDLALDTLPRSVHAWDLELGQRVTLDVAVGAGGLHVAQGETPGDHLLVMHR